MGRENESGDKATTLGVAPGLGLGCNPGLGLYKEILEFYSKLCFVKEDGKLNLNTIVDYTTQILESHGLKNIDEIQECGGVWVYPKEFFCPHLQLIT